MDNGNGTATLSTSSLATSAGSYPLTLSASHSPGTSATEQLTLSIIATGNTQPLVIGTGTGDGALEIDNPNGSPKLTITNPFPGHGDRVAVGDLKGDGVSDVVVVPGPGAQPWVAVYNGNTGQMIDKFLAFPKTFHGGLFVTTGDINGDGTADIIVAQGYHEVSKGKISVFGGPNMSLLSGTPVEVAAAFLRKFRRSAVELAALEYFKLSSRMNN